MVRSRFLQRDIDRLGGYCRGYTYGVGPSTCMALPRAHAYQGYGPEDNGQGATRQAHWSYSPRQQQPGESLQVPTVEWNTPGGQDPAVGHHQGRSSRSPSSRPRPRIL